ncbi:hypothetical protein AYI68_g760 [Smittium mucronatum]|uniref:PhoD-like phosphatase domain-containing protein n=1 Tax=Smittium mucronatum TaxID=133383 RepID=A0A1R0H7E7_9FUNG|nr:hypothetical protein AYI68_g760 [Smittium mucronatum]
MNTNDKGSSNSQNAYNNSGYNPNGQQLDNQSPYNQNVNPYQGSGEAAPPQLSPSSTKNSKNPFEEMINSSQAPQKEHQQGNNQSGSGYNSSPHGYNPINTQSSPQQNVSQQSFSPRIGSNVTSTIQASTQNPSAAQNYSQQNQTAYHYGNYQPPADSGASNPQSAYAPHASATIAPSNTNSQTSGVSQNQTPGSIQNSTSNSSPSNVQQSVQTGNMGSYNSTSPQQNNNNQYSLNSGMGNVQSPSQNPLENHSSSAVPLDSKGPGYGSTNNYANNQTQQAVNPSQTGSFSTQSNNAITNATSNSAYSHPPSSAYQNSTSDSAPQNYNSNPAAIQTTQQGLPLNNQAPPSTYQSATVGSSPQNYSTNPAAIQAGQQNLPPNNQTTSPAPISTQNSNVGIGYAGVTEKMGALSMNQNNSQSSAPPTSSEKILNTTTNVYNTSHYSQDPMQSTSPTSPNSPNVLYGPVLQYINTDIQKAEWIGSVLMVTDANLTPSKGNVGSPSSVGPSVLIWKDGTNIGNPSFAETLPSELFFHDTINGFKFWRAYIKFFLPDLNEIPISYQAVISNQGTEVRSTIFNFCLPSQKTAWRWCAVSNSDTKSSVKSYLKQFPDSDSLWDDLIKKHNNLPFHVMVGMGGQINGDDIWKDLGHAERIVESSLSSPYAKPVISNEKLISDGPLSPFIGYQSNKGFKFIDKYARKEIPWSQNLEAAVSKWYFSKYMNLWFNSLLHGHIPSSGSSDMSIALATIPYTFCLDENDIFPGYGSYGATISSSPVFRGISSIAIRYWCLFQAHVTFDEVQTNNIKNNPFISANGQHWIKNLGPFISLVGLDVSSFRTKKQMMNPYAYDDIFRGIEKSVGSQVQQLIICSSIPIIYPTPMYMDSLLSGAKNIGVMGLINYASNKFASSNKMPMPYGNPQNPPDSSELDNAINHLGDNKTLLTLNSLWSSQGHDQERLLFVYKLQGLLALRPNVRVSFISGFVNCSSSGRFSSIQDVSPNSGFGPNSQNDGRLMVQLISAGITEIPIDKLNMKGLTMSSRSKYLDDYTRETFTDLFTVGVDGLAPSDGNQRFLARRSFLTMEESTVFNGGQYNTSSTSLVCFIHAEAIPNAKKDPHSKTVSYQVVIPPNNSFSQQPNYYSPTANMPSPTDGAQTFSPAPMAQVAGTGFTQSVGPGAPELPPRLSSPNYPQVYPDSSLYHQSTNPPTQQYSGTGREYQAIPGAVESNSLASNTSSTAYTQPAATQGLTASNTSDAPNPHVRRYPTNPYSGTSNSANDAPPPYSDVDPSKPIDRR